MNARPWLTGTALALLLSLAQAQDYPTKPVKIVVPFTAGSATDRGIERCLCQGDTAHVAQDLMGRRNMFEHVGGIEQ